MRSPDDFICDAYQAFADFVDDWTGLSCFRLLQVISVLWLVFGIACYTVFLTIGPGMLAFYVVINLAYIVLAEVRHRDSEPSEGEERVANPMRLDPTQAFCRMWALGSFGYFFVVTVLNHGQKWDEAVSCFFSLSLLCILACTRGGGGRRIQELLRRMTESALPEFEPFRA